MVAWSAELKEHAVKLAKDGYSATQISEDIAVKFDIHKTRNAVIGCLFRLGHALHGRESAKTKNRRAQEARLRWRKDVPPARAPKPVSKQKAALQKIFSTAEPLPPEQAADVGRVHLYDLESGMCRWVVGEPKDGMFCGQEKEQGLSYCRSHAARAYAPPEVRPRPPFSTPGYNVIEKIEELQPA